ncbi:MAG: hypothetical protein F6K56_04095 [Moorea sp. SIO3G5]|nr:hypothetical protein [Moorena sp. SIO3G5]
MKISSRLYDALKTSLGLPSDWAHLSHLTTCLWMVVGRIQTGEVNLTRWIPHIPCRGHYAQSKQGRMLGVAVQCPQSTFIPCINPITSQPMRIGNKSVYI